MIQAPSQNLEAELSFQKRLAEEARNIAPTSAAKLREIRTTPRWRVDPRAYMYRQIHRLKPKTILVAGCGGGETAVRLAMLGFQVTAFDLSPDFVEVARRRAEIDGVSDRLTISLGDATSIEHPAASFDLIVFELVLHHVPLRRTLENLRPALAKEGHILVFEPISLSRTLERLRNLVPVPKEISENEKQLGQEELATIRELFIIEDEMRFVLTSRLQRLLQGFPSGIRNRMTNPLTRLDYLTTNYLPFLKKYCATTVLTARNR